MANTQNFIKWFWTEFSNIHRITSNEDGLCQCETEEFIEKSDQPKLMRSFLALSVFIDQVMYTHFQPVYDDFRMQFRFPKLYSHPHFSLMASANWFIYSFYHLDEKMDWENALSVGHIVFHDLFEWLRQYPDGEELVKNFKKLLEMEVKIEFEPSNADKLLNIISKAQT